MENNWFKGSKDMKHVSLYSIEIYSLGRSDHIFNRNTHRGWSYFFLSFFRACRLSFTREGSSTAALQQSTYVVCECSNISPSVSLQKNWLSRGLCSYLTH